MITTKQTDTQYKRNILDWKDNKKLEEEEEGISNETYSRKTHSKHKYHPINTSFKTKSTNIANYLHVFSTGLIKSQRGPQLLSLSVCFGYAGREKKIYAGAKTLLHPPKGS